MIISYLHVKGRTFCCTDLKVLTHVPVDSVRYLPGILVPNMYVYERSGMLLDTITYINVCFHKTVEP